LLVYDDLFTERVLQAAEIQLTRPRSELLEDLGTYLVSHPNVKPVRRLLRFGGSNFQDFLHSLDEFPSRARLAVPELEMPVLQLRDHTPGNFTLFVTDPHFVFGHVFVGVLRAMADDYGALVLLEHLGTKIGIESISVKVLEANFAEGRTFDFKTGAG
jgi:hypothetical protein